MSKIMTLRHAALVGTLTALAAFGAPAAASAQVAPCGGYYTIQTGDSLLEIAQRCGVSIPGLLAVNPSVRDQMDLEVGGQLAIPAPGMPEPSPQQACGGFYTIQTGDTVAEIAEKCGLTVPLLIAANGPLPDPLGVHVGLKVRIPALPATAARAPTTFAAPPAALPSPAALAREAGAAEAAADSAAAADSVAAAARAAAPELLRFEGVLVNGDGCTLLRTPDGTVWGLAGQLRTFGPGDRVVVLGLETEASQCEAEQVLEVRIAYRPGS